MNDPPLTPDARTLAADLFQAHAPRLVTRLTRAFPGTSQEAVYDCFVQALLQLSRKPECFDPSRASWAGFLYGAARRLLGRHLRAEQRRGQREQRNFEWYVTKGTPAARSLLEVLADHEEATRAREVIARSDVERRVLDLWLLGETDLRAFMEALGRPTLPPPEQEACVRRLLARLRQRLHRYRRDRKSEDMAS
jgi:DNA-directed RNA polymerase specialized sigma24 family protein